ncbi:hypothetical protein HAX54_047816 [Datura stramonium]|uniref:S-protein homolog n=1 Tax=Datura stramonium TaxID=4076 RepID=A0ABS8STK5_DATST|nr:hypothetical protein [Datura stramonium]
MGSTSFSIFLIFVVSLTLSQFSFSNPTPIVTLMDRLSSAHVPNMTVTCKIKTGLPLLSVTMVSGQDFSFEAGITNDIYVCFARWGDLWTDFDAYDPIKADKDQLTVFWSIRDIGLYKKYGKSN